MRVRYYCVEEDGDMEQALYAPRYRFTHREVAVERLKERIMDYLSSGYAIAGNEREGFEATKGGAVVRLSIARGTEEVEL